MQLKPLQSPYTSGQLFQHTDGGFYRYLCSVYSSEDQSEKVVYEHLWPFDVSGWERPLSQFLSRFKPVTQADLEAAMNTDRMAAQLAVVTAKAARRDAEKTS